MSDKKTLAVVLGTVVGVAAVAAAIGVYVARQDNDPAAMNVNDVFEKARKTVARLDEAVEMLKNTATA